MEVFHVNTEGILLLQEWRLNSTSVLLGACLATFLLTVFYESLKIFRQWLTSRPLNLLYRDLTQSASTSEVGDSEESTLDNKESLQQRIIRYPRQSGRWRRDIHLLQTFLHVLQVFVGYLLMLIVMTYNVWLGVALLTGAGAGYMVFSVIFPDNLRLRRIDEKALDALVLGDLSCQKSDHV